MKVDHKLSRQAALIAKILDDAGLSPTEATDLLMQILIKNYLFFFKNDQELLVNRMRDMYNALEEHGNQIGVI